MKVQEAIDAYRDGTFERKAKATAERRQKEAKPANPGGVQRGRDLFKALHNKKEK